MNTKGFFWHVHHGTLVEYSDNINKRIEYIKENKPKHEIELRLKLMKPVKGKLSREVIKAGKSYYNEWKAYNKTVGKAFSNKIYEVMKAYYKEKRIYLKVLENHRKEIEALHKKECPNCPWDGITIFSEKNEVK